MDSHPRVEDELGEALHARARARGYRSIARPAVRLLTSNDAARGDIQAPPEGLDVPHLNSTGTMSASDGPPPGFAPPLPAALHPPGMPLAPMCRPGSSAHLGRRPAAVGGPSHTRCSRDWGVLSRATTDAASDQPPTPPTGAYVRVGRSPHRPVWSRPQCADVPDRHGRGADGWAAGRNPGLRRGHAPSAGVATTNGPCPRRVSRHHGKLMTRRAVPGSTPISTAPTGGNPHSTRVRDIVLGSGDVSGWETRR